MAATASPIDIATPPRYNSASPRNQTSNLTFQLQGAGAAPMQVSAMDIGTRSGNDGRASAGRHDSANNLGSSYYGTGARPISVKDRPRRESAAGSFLNQMSWGGVSVGSFIRDDFMMAGTSPYTFHQSPSFHSSSYLPKMETNFLSGYTCCGQELNSLHELLQHFEENHAQPSAQIMHRLSQSGQDELGPGGRSSSVSAGTGSIQQQQYGNQQNTFRPGQAGSSQPSRSQQLPEGFNRTPLSTVQDMDGLEDMEMDDAAGPLPSLPQQSFQGQQQRFGQPAQQIPPLNVGMANAMQTHQGLRTSTPTTPSAGSQGFPLQNNPTVSSVNTPALSTQSLQQQQKTSPESSVPGTPAELDPDFAASYMGGFPMDMQQGGGASDWGSGLGYLGANMSEMTIDEPAKRLFSKHGGGLTNAQLQYALKNGQLGADSELAKRLREQQLVAGLGGNPVGFPEAEHKPYKCPVIGCEKAYKNQNGLKYHKQHGHQNQRLKENPDGTFSIVDPLTAIPYPGTVGMEKEKPYRCDVCGKRYKNLNGLKYHRQHSPPCNPDLRLNPVNVPGAPGGLQGLGAGGMGVGFGMGMGEGF